MDYQESLDYLYGLQKFGIKLGLENIQALLGRLGNPQQDYRVLHVAGTNGKGSVSAALAEIFRQAGYRVGHYSSPHLHSFTERIQVDGRPISEAEVVALTERVRSQSGGIPATFFEFTTALALIYFRCRRVDFAVLEVGMGGRLDATNAVSPELCLITPICLDHGEHLGANLAAIAAEKAGIIKPGVPVVISRQPAEVLEVLLERADQMQAPAVVFGRDYTVTATGETFSFSSAELNLAGLRPGLVGAHQQQNLSQALACCMVLRRGGEQIGEPALRDGVARVRWPGRLEWWQGRGEVLLDGAHNQGGALALADYLKTLPAAGIRWVVGIKDDKCLADILGPVLPLVSRLYCTVPPVESAIAPEALAAQACLHDVASSIFADVCDALAAALNDRRPGEVVLVAGSLFLVGAARQWLLEHFSEAPGETGQID